MTNKITKTQVFNAIAQALDTVVIDGVTVNVADFCNHEVELIQNKASKASARKSVDNSAWEAKVTEVLSAKGMLTPTEIMSATGMPNTQKVSAVVGKMTNVTKSVKGKKVFYSLV